jgi:hypothetical protein
METEARKGRRNAEKEKFWREAVQEHGGSGKSVRKFCEEKGLNENLFYGWRRELKLRDGETTGRGVFVELIRRGAQGGAAGVCIRVGERVNIVVERGFDSQTLKAVLSAVGA